METFGSCSRCERTQLMVWLISDRVPNGFCGCRNGSAPKTNHEINTANEMNSHRKGQKCFTRFGGATRHPHVQ